MADDRRGVCLDKLGPNGYTISRCENATLVLTTTGLVVMIKVSDDFTVTVPFRVVAELSGVASDWLNQHVF